MDKAFLNKLDNSEFSRINAFKQSDKKEKINPVSAFRSDVVRKMVEKGHQTFISGFDNEILPTTIPFSERTFVEICPACECVASPGLLMPYLERDLVVPVLNSSYSKYSPNFIEKIFSYPHISVEEFYGIRNIALRNSSIVSEKEIESLKKNCLALAKKNSFSDEAGVSGIVNHFEPFYSSDMPFLLEVYKNIQNQQVNNFNKQSDLSHLVNAFRCSQAFSFVPQVTLNELETLGLIPLENQGVIFDLADVRNTVMNSLKISYNSSIPIETYLDIVSERKTKIQGIIRPVMDKVNPDRASFLSDLESELEKINTEVRTLEKSNRGKTIDLFTNFAIQNKGSIIAGLVTAASIGLMGFSVVGCGSGGIVSTLASKAISKKASFSIPQEAGKLGGRISSFFEPSYEKLLAASLSTDIQAIQIWRLSKRLSKSKLEADRKTNLRKKKKQ